MVDKEILLYSDLGVGPSSLEQTYKSLKACLPYPIRMVKHQDFISKDWEEKTILVVIPGGRDLPYHQLLQGAGNQRIAGFIRQGGRYLGICAGAYYGASYIEYEKGKPSEIVGARELGFFPGKAIGPAYDKAHLAPIQWMGENEVTPLYYNGGCHFELKGKSKNISVLAKYNDLNLNAIVSCQVGKGTAILSGMHPEYSAAALKYEHPDLMMPLKKNEEKRILFWKRLLQFFQFKDGQAAQS